MSVIDKIHMLKKILKETEKLVTWQEDIFTALHNIHAGWVVSGRFGMSRMPDMGLDKIMVGQGAGNSPVEEDKLDAQYKEEIPDTDFALTAIDNVLTNPPPNADAENSVVDIDQDTDHTFVLRSLWVNVTSFGTAGTKLTFKLWVPLNSVVTMVNSVDITSTGIQNLVDIFGLQEVHADGIWITVETDSAEDPGDAACSGTFRSAKA